MRIIVLALPISQAKVVSCVLMELINFEVLLSMNVGSLSFMKYYYILTVNSKGKKLFQTLQIIICNFYTLFPQTLDV